LAAYAEHAAQLGHEDAATFAFVHETLAKLRDAETNVLPLEELLGMALKVGEMNAGVMAMLDKAHKETFGVPSPSPVNRAAKAGKALLVSGHDMADLKAILEMTEGTGVNVYTHGEMMPAHGYGELKKYPHLVGNYGGAWQHQNLDFTLFPGPIIVTTNCLVEPRKSYADRIYTTNAVGFDGVKHIKNRDFAPVIEQAKQLEGFAADEPEKLTTIGFGHDAIIGLADTIVQLVKAGKISRFFFIGGCDGTEGERSYFTKLAKASPKDSVILTAGCGKYRINHLKLGELGETGLPRVLDMGQCNDSYGAVKVALALAQAFETDVNGLPLSLAVSWFEQKAVAVLLTLLHFNVRNIRLGPALPAFITPNVLNVLVENFALKPIGDPKEDLEQMMKE
jgi:hydroxylamine reductase